MPRNGSGVYSLPPGSTFVPNTLAQSSVVNGINNDLATDLNTPRPIVAGGTGASTKIWEDMCIYASKSGNYTAIATDNNAIHTYTAAATVTLTPAASLLANWHYTVVAYGGAVTVDPNGAETINGQATLVLPIGTSAKIICDGANFFVVFKPAVWNVIGDYTLSAAASLPIINLSAFEMIRMSGYIENTAAVGVLVRTSSNNGVSYDSGASDYSSQFFTAAGAVTSASSSTGSAMVITGGMDAGANLGVNFDFQLYNFNKAKNCRYKSNALYVTSSAFAESSIGGSRAQATARNALQILCLSGTMTGRVVVEGI